MKKYFVLCLLAMATALQAQPDFHLNTVGKQRIVTGSVDAGNNDKTAFANAMLWAVERCTLGKDLIEECDFEQRRFAIVYNIIREGETSFAARLTVEVTDGNMAYVVSDIKGQSAGITGLLGAVDFNKMNPDKKPKQKQMIQEFEAVNKQELTTLFDAIKQQDTSIDHWQAIAAGRLEKGMLPSDVLLILGKPADIQQSGSMVQYMYNTFTYVYFEDGKVKSFTQ